jgi:hypothetical protein
VRGGVGEEGGCAEVRGGRDEGSVSERNGRRRDKIVFPRAARAGRLKPVLRTGRRAGIQHPAGGGRLNTNAHPATQFFHATPMKPALFRPFGPPVFSRFLRGLTATAITQYRPFRPRIS